MGAGRTEVENEDDADVVAGRIAWIGPLRQRAAAFYDALLTKQQGRFVLWLGPATLSGAVLYFAAPAEPPFAAALLGPVCALGALWLWGRSGSALAVWIAALLAAAACGWSAGVVRTRFVEAPRLSTPIAATVSGLVIAEGPAQRGRRVTLAEIDVAGLHGLTARISFSDATAPPATVGERIAVSARLRPPPPPLVSGGFDQQQYLWFQGVGAIGWATGPIERLEPTRLSSIDVLRRRLGDGIRAVLPGPSGEVTAAVAVGDRSGISPAVDAALRDAGLSHILSISGLHIALVAVFVTGFLRLAIAAWPWLCLRVDPRKPAAFGALLAVGFYCALAGWDPPVVRSFVMAGFALGAILIDREPFSLRVWSWALAVVVLIEPEAALNPGFQMSFAATLALLAATERWSRAAARLKAAGGWPYWLAGWLLEGLAASGAATLATAPYSAYHFHRVSLVGIVSNLAAGPLSGVLIMPGVVLAAPLSVIGWPEPALWWAGWGVEGLLWVARVTAAWPGANLVIPHGAPAALLWLSLGGLWLCLWRGRLRLAGLAPALLGGLIWMQQRPPDLVIEPERGAMLLRGEDGFWGIGGAPSGFFQLVTSERWGLSYRGRASWAGLGEDCVCQEGLCRLTRDGATAWLALTDKAAARARRQPPEAGPLIAPRRRTAAAEGRVILDRDFIARNGAIALWFTGGRIVWDVDRSHRGDRPWTRYSATDGD